MTSNWRQTLLKMRVRQRAKFIPCCHQQPGSAKETIIDVSQIVCKYCGSTVPYLNDVSSVGWFVLIKFIKCVFQVLLSGDETLQVTSAKCIASILVHSPSQYSTPFIKADVPGTMHTHTCYSLLWLIFYFPFASLSCLLVLSYPKSFLLIFFFTVVFLFLFLSCPRR